MNRIKKKTKSRAGETIAETLVAVLIIALAFVMLCGAVGAAARVNASANNNHTAFTATEKGTATATVNLTLGSFNETATYSVKTYGNEIYTYYE